MERDSPSIDSLFDYLYIDHVRVASLLAQLSDRGHLTSVKEDARTQSSAGGSVTVGVSPLAIGEFKTTSETSKGTDSASSWTYDPLWLNARSILDKLDELGLVHRDVQAAGVGQIVVVSGDLTISDLRVLRPIWGSIFNLVGHVVEVPDALKRQLEGMGSRSERRRAERDQRKHGGGSVAGQDAAEFQRKAFLEVAARFFEEMPHAVQGNIVGATARSWFTLNPSRMNVSPEELALQHGEVIPGLWHAVGIVDAIPGPLPVGPNPEGAASLTREMTSHVREQFGRPATSYGLTPLMVFRELAGVRKES